MRILACSAMFRYSVQYVKNFMFIFSIEKDGSRNTVYCLPKVFKYNLNVILSIAFGFINKAKSNTKIHLDITLLANSIEKDGSLNTVYCLPTFILINVILSISFGFICILKCFIKVKNIKEH